MAGGGVGSALSSAVTLGVPEPGSGVVDSIPTRSLSARAAAASASARRGVLWTRSERSPCEVRSRDATWRSGRHPVRPQCH